jgi:hypothetical protein
VLHAPECSLAQVAWNESVSWQARAHAFLQKHDVALARLAIAVPLQVRIPDLFKRSCRRTDHAGQGANRF